MNQITYKPEAFPKIHGCGKSYTQEEWVKLPFSYIGYGIFEGHRPGKQTEEYRHCECMSTIGVPIEDRRGKQ